MGELNWAPAEQFNIVYAAKSQEQTLGLALRRQLFPLIDVSAGKMLRPARMAAMTGHTAAS
jgi:hypothetical protein